MMKRCVVFFLIIWLAITGTNPVFASDAGPNEADSAVTTGVKVDWVNPTNALADDSNYATASLSGAAPDSDQLQITDFDFAIPSGATINGIKFTVKRKRAGSGGCTDLNDYVIKGGTDQTTQNKAIAASWSSTDETVTYGANNDLWGVAWSDSDINSTGFGVSISAERTATNPVASVQYVTCTVTYTEAGGTTRTQFRTLRGVGF